MVGKSLITLASMLASKIEWCIAEAERIKGSPASIPEIACVYQHNYCRWMISGAINAFVQNLYREDRFYANR